MAFNFFNVLGRSVFLKFIESGVGSYVSVKVNTGLLLDRNTIVNVHCKNFVGRFSVLDAGCRVSWGVPLEETIIESHPTDGFIAILCFFRTFRGWVNIVRRGIIF